jgi:hypothetical protein
MGLTLCHGSGSPHARRALFALEPGALSCFERTVPVHWKAA